MRGVVGERGAAARDLPPLSFATIVRGSLRRGGPHEPGGRDRGPWPSESGGGGRVEGSRDRPAPPPPCTPTTSSHCNHAIVQRNFIQANNPNNMSNVGTIISISISPSLVRDLMERQVKLKVKTATTRTVRSITRGGGGPHRAIRPHCGPALPRKLFQKNAYSSITFTSSLLQHLISFLHR